MRVAISRMKSVSEIVLSSKEHVGRGIFEQHPPPQNLLHLIDVVADRGERLLRVGQRQEIVQIALVVAGPGEMFGKQARLVARGERREASEMFAVERFWRSDRKSDAVQGNRIERANRLEPAMRRPSGAHVVLGMDLEKSECRPVAKDLVDMFRLQADPAAIGQRRSDARRGTGRRTWMNSPDG